LKIEQAYQARKPDMVRLKFLDDDAHGISSEFPVSL
jgi:hypothetical protein